MTRIEQLEQFITEDPSDPFPRYALALEFLHLDPAKAQAQFESLISQFPDYLPTYYPAAHLLAERGDAQGADTLFQSGIAKARQQGDRKTEHELRQAYSQWQFEQS